MSSAQGQELQRASRDATRGQGEEMERQPNAAANPFASAEAAMLYAHGRPAYPPALMERIRAMLGLREPVRFALDVGCGTGQSTVAVADLASQVLGVDASAEMIAHALPHPHVTYAVASAEALPVAESSCDLMTVASAFPWFDRSAFLAQAHRALRHDGWLLLYDLAFTGTVAGAPRVGAWVRQSYLRAYPFPPRNREPLDATAFAAAGFDLTQEERITQTYRFTCQELAAFLASQANTLAALEHGQVTTPALLEQLDHELARAMGRRHEVACTFRGAIRFIRRLS